MGGQLHGSKQELDSLLCAGASDNALQSLKIWYFEKGHTFMAADSLHLKVEAAMREMKKLYNFNDAVNKHGFTIKMEPEELSCLGTN